MTVCKWGVVWAGLWACTVVADPLPTAVDLGGPRQIKGQVTVAVDDYTVTVTFRPVRVFDPATNDEINRELGQEYALRVLAKHLSAAADVQFETSRTEVRETKSVGERFHVTVRWPRGGVKILADPVARKPTGRVISPAAFTNKFFTAKQDHLDTVAAVLSANKVTIRRASEKAASAPDADRRRVLVKGVAAAEDRGLAAFDALAVAVKNDQNLLDLTERPDVLAAITTARAEFLADLKSALEDPPAAKLSFRDVMIEKPFDKYLKEHPLVMDLAGAVLIEAEAGDWLLIGVGKTILKDGSADEILRAEKVCTLKARAAAIGERDGTHITYLKRVEDRVVIVKEASGEEKVTTVSDRLKVTKEKIEGVAKNLPVIGHWRSEDGKVFYLAVGGKIPRELIPKGR